MELKCPYCKSDLVEGFIGGQRYFLKWYDKDISFVEKYTIMGGEIVCGCSRIKSYRCINCNKIIIDLDEND